MTDVIDPTDVDAIPGEHPPLDDQVGEGQPQPSVDDRPAVEDDDGEDGG